MQSQSAVHVMVKFEGSGRWFDNHIYSDADGLTIYFRDVSHEMHAQQQLQLLSSRVLEVQESERRRIAHELHDELGQSLTAIKINWRHKIHRTAFRLPRLMRCCVLLCASQHHKRARTEVTANISSEMWWSIPTGLKCCFAVWKLFLKTTTLTRQFHNAPFKWYRVEESNLNSWLQRPES